MHDSTYPNEHIQVLLYYELAVNLDRCVESYNTINVLSNTVCVQNKTGDLNFIVFNMTTGINESKTLRNIYHGNVNISLMAKNMTQIYVSIKIQENVICAKETFFWNSATCSCQNDKYLGSIIDDSVAICDKVIDTSKTVPTKTSSAKNASTNFYILFCLFLNYHSIIDSC